MFDKFVVAPGRPVAIGEGDAQRAGAGRSALARLSWVGVGQWATLPLENPVSGFLFGQTVFALARASVRQ